MKEAKAKEPEETKRENTLAIGEITLSSSELAMADLIEALVFLLEDCKPVKDYLASLSKRGSLKEAKEKGDYIG